MLNLLGGLLLLGAASAVQQTFGAAGNPEPAPLDETLMNVLDKNHDGKVMLSEVNESLDGFAAMGAMGQEPGQGPSEVTLMLRAAKIGAPGIFKLMDADASGALTQDELKWVETAYTAIATQGVLKKLVQDIFAAIDSDSDETMSEAEMRAAVESETLDVLLGIIKAQLPIPALSAESSRATLQENFKEVVGHLDTDGDGAVERKEMLAAARAFKAMFMKGVKTVKEMGPMLAMFSAFQQPEGRGARGAGTRGRGRGRG